MKKIFTLIVLLIVTTLSFAQVPNLMNYQAVARNAQGQAMANQAIKVKLTLQVGNALAIPFYSETRSVTTNALGLFNVQVGSAGAQNVVGSISGTNWLDGNNRSMKVEIDVNNSGSFVDMGSQQLVSVPYALAAKEAETAKKVVGPFIGFRADNSSNTIINSGYTPCIFGFERFDSSGVYNSGTGEFTAPEDGMYSISTSVNIYVNSTLAGSDRAALTFYRTGSITDYMHNSNGFNADQGLRSGTNMLYGNILTHLKAGDKVVVKIYTITKTVDWRFADFGSSFQAYKIK
jgi:hypothetical protein